MGVENNKNGKEHETDKGRKMSWDELFVKMTMLVSEKSKDTSTKVGAVIVGQDNEVLSKIFFHRTCRTQCHI